MRNTTRETVSPDSIEHDVLLNYTRAITKSSSTEIHVIQNINKGFSTLCTISKHLK